MFYKYFTDYQIVKSWGLLSKLEIVCRKAISFCLNECRVAYSLRNHVLFGLQCVCWVEPAWCWGNSYTHASRVLIVFIKQVSSKITQFLSSKCFLSWKRTVFFCLNCLHCCSTKSAIFQKIFMKNVIFWLNSRLIWSIFNICLSSQLNWLNC